MNKLKKHKHKILFGTGVSLLLVAGLASINSINPPTSASLVILPISESFPLDQNFSVDIVVNAIDPINAVDAKITFPADKLEVAEVSKEGSIMLLWAEEPSFSNASGTIKFVGGLYNGFTGQGGKIISIIFKPKAAGVAKVLFEDARVLAHDGKGTDILKQKTDAIYLIKSEKPPSPDFDGDGKVGVRDISILLFHLGSSYDPRYDLDQDGAVGMRDFSIFLSKFGSSY